MMYINYNSFFFSPKADLMRKIMSHVINDWHRQDEGKRDMNDLGGDSIAIVIAGRCVMIRLDLEATENK